jgi:hypothetical protein
MTSEGAAELIDSKIDVDSRPLVQFFALAPMSIVALLSGAFAAGGLAFEMRTWLSVVIAAITVCAWSILWSLIASTNWHTPLQSWKTWHTGKPFPVLPYTEPNSPSEKTSITLGFLRHWLQREILPQHGNAILLGVVAWVIAFVLSASLGAQTFLLTITLVCLAQIVAILSHGAGKPNLLLEQICVVALPLLFGQAMFKPITPIIACIALGLSLMATNHFRLRNLGYGATLLVLVLMRHTIGAFVIAVLWMPNLMLAGFRPNRWWIIASMLSTALALS